MIRREKLLSGLGHPTYWLIVGLVFFFVVRPASVVAWAIGCVQAIRERNWSLGVFQAVLALFFGILFVQLFLIDVSWNLGLKVGP